MKLGIAAPVATVSDTESLVRVGLALTGVRHQWGSPARC